jgi:hypothetical protein
VYLQPGSLLQLAAFCASFISLYTIFYKKDIELSAIVSKRSLFKYPDYTPLGVRQQDTTFSERQVRLYDTRFYAILLSLWFILL